ncbi:MAG TPA: head GIN domain-containing protein [Chitinophagaceae bacterium]|nr:head GIN domain-containing protein [Chitinophagaceae bacterium]
MKKLIAACFCLLAVAGGFAQEKVINDANAEARKVGSFHAIRVSNGIDLIIKQGSTEAVAVSAATKEYRDNIKTEVVDGVLKIYYDTKWYKDWSSNGKKLKAYVSFKEIDLLHGSAGSYTTVDGQLNGGKLRIELSSGAGFKGALDAGSLSVDGSSGAIARISGKAQSASLEASSGAGVYGYELISDKCDADASSGGAIEVSVNKELSAEASSGGDIRYKGNGVITKVSTGSGGSVKKNG